MANKVNSGKACHLRGDTYYKGELHARLQAHPAHPGWRPVWSRSLPRLFTGFPWSGDPGSGWDMISPGNRSRVYLALGVTDMRKAINGLSILVADILKQDPFSGHIFAFCNRRQNIIKALYWDRNGFCLWSKRLEKNRFAWPKSKEEVKQVDMRQFLWLLDGLSVEQKHAHKKLSYSLIF